MNEAKVRMIPNPVPPITDPMGSGWKQPDSENFKFFQEVSGGPMFVSMTEPEKNNLPRYDRGFPTGVYDGKMWLCEDSLVWFAPYPEKPDHCRNMVAKLICNVE
jgi:hypothetical protein